MSSIYSKYMPQTTDKYLADTHFSSFPPHPTSPAVLRNKRLEKIVLLYIEWGVLQFVVIYFPSSTAYLSSFDEFETDIVHPVRKALSLNWTYEKRP